MALTGHLSDLSLSELIEFFCNQRKTGQLKVLYPQGPGYFYLQTGSVVDARIGVLRGIDAVYYALTLPNAKFEFGGSPESAERTITQPWTQVVLEGLRGIDGQTKVCNRRGSCLCCIWQRRSDRRPGRLVQSRQNVSGCQPANEYRRCD